MGRQGYIIRKGERIPFIQTQGGFANAEAGADLWVEFREDYIELRPIKTGARVDSAVIVRAGGPITLPLVPRAVRINGDPIDMLGMSLNPTP